MYSLVFVKQTRLWCLYPISDYVLSGCGWNTAKPAIKQNPCMCLLCFPLTISPPLVSPYSSLTSTLFFCLPLIWLFSSPTFLPLAVCPRRSSSGAWEKLTVVSPENLSESGERKGRRRGEHLAQHIYHSRQFVFYYGDRIRLVKV